MFDMFLEVDLKKEQDFRYGNLMAILREIFDRTKIVKDWILLELLIDLLIYDI